MFRRTEVTYHYETGKCEVCLMPLMYFVGLRKLLIVAFGTCCVCFSYRTRYRYAVATVEIREKKERLLSPPFLPFSFFRLPIHYLK